MSHISSSGHWAILTHAQLFQAIPGFAQVFLVTGSAAAGSTKTAASKVTTVALNEGRGREREGEGGRQPGGKQRLAGRRAVAVVALQT